MPHHFDAETQLASAGENRFTTELTANWNIGDNPNGGYLLAPLLKAMQLGSGHVDPLTVTTHYLRPGEAGPATVEVEPVRVGRTVGTMRGRLSQGDRTRLESIAAFTDLTAGDAVAELSPRPPSIPPPDQCPSRAEVTQGVDLPLLDRVDVRMHPDHVEAGTGRAPQITGWIRFTDERPIDTTALCLFADAFPPPLFAMLGPIGWVPTIELTVHVRRRPVDGWILGHFETADAAGPRVIENAQLWDESGALVAVARQVGLVLTAS